MLAKIKKIMLNNLGDKSREKLNKLYESVIRLTNIISAKLFSKLFKNISKFGYGSNICYKDGYIPMPVHFYSPIPDLDDLERCKVWDKRSELRGIDFNEKNQLKILEELGQDYGQECV